MKYNTYNNRRQVRSRTPEPPSIGERLVEQFLTQVVVCSLLIIIIVGVQLLGIKQFESGINKMKSAIVYSPSFNEIAENAKSTFAEIRDSIIADDKKEETIPVILIDDEVL